MVALNKFKNFVLNYVPFKWEKPIQKTGMLNYKTSLEISFFRFYKIYSLLSKIKKESKIIKIIDVGPYPGTTLKMCKNLFSENLQYTAIGLGFTKDFVNTFKKLNAKCLETEIDPSFVEPKPTKPWNKKNQDICLLLDVIEHLSDPVYCLDQVNKSLKNEGFLIITTDNISSIRYVIGMMVSGKSPNNHPIRSSLIYRGDWRPHHKEFSKEELEFYLKFCGFEIISHEYFNREMYKYIVDYKNKKIKKLYWPTSLKNLIFLILSFFSNRVPHLRDHQILLAQKINKFENVSKKRNIAYTKSEWFKIRNKYNL